MNGSCHNHSRRARDDRRQAALLAAMGLGMAASNRDCGAGAERAMRRAVARTGEAMPASDPVWRLTRDIARDWVMLMRNPDQLVDRGQMLLRAVERATWPDASTRSDIEG